jgi:hypothetical protein
MGNIIEAFVAFDTSKLRNAVAEGRPYQRRHAGRHVLHQPFFEIL